MIEPKYFYDLALSHETDFFAGVPDSLLKNFCAYITDNAPSDKHIISANEGSATALAAGYHFATGKTPLIYMQNSGEGNMINPLLSLADPDVYSVPMLILIGWRGEPGVYDEPQHVKQGKVTCDLLDAMKVPEEYKCYDPASRLQETLRKKESIHILIGHSAVRRMRHMEVLDYLKKFSDRDIKLLIPLSYGDKQYADEVQQYAEGIFNEKAVCLCDFMPQDEYFNLLKRVDIAIFNTYEQSGLGNINRLIFRNVKVYMPENSVVYRYYKSNFVPISKLSEMTDSSFEELISLPVYENRERCTEFLKSFGDMESFRLKPWRKIYGGIWQRYLIEG